ncbi:MAG: hypothetical protein PHU63_01085 [Candidatus ainarchaeum sp.]|nr:hypothetical protein [Candidatus ainarchaeum sp.]
MKELTIISPNKVGSLAIISESLGSVGVNIEAISAYEMNNKAVFRILTTDVTTAVKAISKLPEFTVSEDEIIVITLSNRPGELGKITRKLANRNISLESLYIFGKKNNETEVAIKPSKSDFGKAKEVLGIK